MTTTAADVGIMAGKPFKCLDLTSVSFQEHNRVISESSCLKVPGSWASLLA